MSTKRFYDTIRPLFNGGMKQDQVNGCNRLLNACKKYRTPRQHAAYVLATSFHETGQKMQPVSENLNYTAKRIRAVWPSRFKSVKAAEPYAGNAVALANKVYSNRMGNGDEASGDGWRFRGRGDVQNTGRENYRRAGKAIGVDLESNPDRMLDPEISAQVLVVGMQRGWFTGVSLDDVSEPETSAPDFTNDRAIVNGKDRAKDIAAVADVFYEALKDVDLLAESRIIQASRNTRITSTIGAVTSAATGAGAVVTQVVTENQEELVTAATTGSTLGKFIPWLAVILPTIMVGLFIINKINANRAEKARREDNEKNGV